VVILALALKMTVPVAVKTPADLVQGVEEPVTVMVLPLSIMVPFDWFREPMVMLVELVRVVEPDER